MYERPRDPARTRAPRDQHEGQSLDSGTRQRLQRAFGGSIPDVRIHDDAHADARARHTGAVAWTYGRDIGFRRGAYRPGTLDGDLLIAHELAHAVQQRDAGAPDDDRRSSGALEADADVVTGHAALHLAGVDAGPRVPLRSSGLRLSRCPQKDETSGSGAEAESARAPAERSEATAPEPEPEPETPEARRQRIFGEEGGTFITGTTEWLEAQTTSTEGRIARRRREYEQRDWGGVENDDRIRRYTERIERLGDFRRRFQAEIDAVQRHGSNVLVLANVIVNEAGASNDAAKRAIAYAWLNRTGGAVREPTGAEISGYQRLPDRWRALNDTGRLTFIEQFIPCIRAARQRLEDANPAANDPTGGATHWVSPSGLPRYQAARHAATRYSRTVGTARDRAFPNWARDPDTEEARALREEGAVGDDYAEVTVPGVPSTEFLFYRDVR